MALPYVKLSTRLEYARRESRALFDGGDDAPTDEASMSSATPLVITCVRSGPSTTLALRGELDLYSRHQLEQEFGRAEDVGFDRMVVDLSALDFMDCSGMHALLGAQRRAHAAGRQLSLRRGPREVHRLFELAGVDQLFAFEPATEVAT